MEPASAATEDHAMGIAVAGAPVPLANGATGAAATSSESIASAAVAPELTPLQVLEGHLSTSLHHLWTSALIVEQGVAGGATHASAVDPELERLMGLAQPRMSVADATNQNLHRHIEGYLQSLMSIDRVGRDLQLTLPKSVIECVESGHNPSLISQRHIEEAKFKHESVRAKVFATKVLHDQLQLRMDLWDQMLAQEAAAGNQASRTLLHATMDTLKQHHVVTPAAATPSAAAL